MARVNANAYRRFVKPGSLGWVVRRRSMRDKKLGRLGSNSQATCGNLTGTSWLHSRRPTHGFFSFSVPELW